MLNESYDALLNALESADFEWSMIERITKGAVVQGLQMSVLRGDLSSPRAHQLWGSYQSYLAQSNRYTPSPEHLEANIEYGQATLTEEVWNIFSNLGRRKE